RSSRAPRPCTIARAPSFARRAPISDRSADRASREARSFLPRLVGGGDGGQVVPAVLAPGFLVVAGRPRLLVAEADRRDLPVVGAHRGEIALRGVGAA